MANTNSPFGFLQYYGGSGGAPTFSQTTRKIASTDANTVFTGDPVVTVNTSNSGYVTRGANGITRPITGIFVGCRYLSTSQKRVVWSAYWPGSDATGDVDAYVIDDPSARFIVQSSWSSPLLTSTTTYGSTPIGQYCDYTWAAGSTATGRSGAYVSSLGTTATLPFIVTDVQTFPPGANGTDVTSQYYNVIVGFNNEWLRTNSAVTGIA
jgi:hypothetical protein